jgi:GMP synthase-like glutamine amidotransferase
MHIGILQTGHAPEALAQQYGDYARLFEQLLDGRDFTFTTWNVVDMAFPPGPDAADGWLITGSRHGAYEDLPFIAPLEAFLRAAYAAGVPIVGICFGHQVLAQALGGKVEKFAGGWSAGRVVYDWEGEAVPLHAWHQDQVTEAPEGARTVATHPGCRHAALVYGNRAFTIQAHPEYDRTFLEGLIEHRGGALPPDRLACARDSIGPPVANAALAERISRFFTERRT